jgi:hypothetical protein
MFDKHGERLLADMVFHPLGVQMGDGVRNAKRLEELDHNLMPPA